MIRYSEVPDSVTDLLTEVQTRHFPELKNAKIAVLFDLKKTAKGGKVQLGCIKRPNDLIRHFTKDEAVNIEGYDYIIILDKMCWNAVGDADHTRIVRHELRHTFYDIESEDNPYKLLDHDITDFYAEVELNKDDPRWAHRCATLTADIYEQEREQSREQKKRKKKGKREYAIHPRQGSIEDGVDREEKNLTLTMPDGTKTEPFSLNDMRRATEHIKEHGIPEEMLLRPDPSDLVCKTDLKGYEGKSVGFGKCTICGKAPVEVFRVKS